MTVAKRLATVGFVGTLLAVGSGAAHAAQHDALSIVRVSSTPKGKGALSMRRVNTVVATAGLAFAVRIRNRGARRTLRLTLTVPRPSLGPIVKSRTVLLGAREARTVTVGPFTPVAFAQRERLKLSIADARSREVWTTVYPVIFSLG